MNGRFDEDITIYNRVARGAEGEVWRRVQVCGVSWRGEVACAAGTGGQTPADRCVVRIPGGAMPPGWVAPRRFAAVAADVPEAWSVQPGDLVVRGLCGTEVTLGISQVTGTESEWFFAAEVHDNLRGAPCGRHVLVMGGL